MADESTNKVKSKVGRPSGEQTNFGRWLENHPDWTKQKLAEALDVTVGHLYALCNGRRIPTRVMAIAIAHVTNEEFDVEQWERLQGDS